MFISARSFFISALVSAACLTAVGCAEDPPADEPTAEIDAARITATTPPEHVPAVQASPGPIRPWSPETPVRPLPRPVDAPREPLTVPAPLSAPTIIVDEEPGLGRRVVPLPRPAIDGATGASVIEPGDAEGLAYR